MISSYFFSCTEESRFLKPPRKTKIGSRNWEFEKSKVALNEAKLLRYCFIAAFMSYFRSNRQEMTILSLVVEQIKNTK